MSAARPPRGGRSLPRSSPAQKMHAVTRSTPVTHLNFLGFWKLDADAITAGRGRATRIGLRIFGDGAENRQRPVNVGPSAARKFRRALLEEGGHAFLHVGGGGAEAEEGGLEDEPLRERHVEAPPHSLEDVAARDRAVGEDRLRHL